MSKRNRKFRAQAALRLIAAILGGVLIFCLLTRLLQPKYYYCLEGRSPETEFWQSFYELPRDSRDVIFLGSSHIYNAVDPAQYEALTGLTAFDMATSNQDMSVSYYLLKECLTRQSPDAVVLDAYGLEMTTFGKSSTYKRTFDDMHWSAAKIGAIRDWMPHMEGETWITRILTILDYHGRWEELTAADLDGRPYVTSRLGFCPSDETAASITYDGVAEDAGEPFAIDPEAVRYFGLIAELCRQEGIALTLIKTPDTAWTAAKSEAAAALAAEYGIPYTDYNAAGAYERIGLAAAEDWRNENHLNRCGAEKFTQFIAFHLH